MSEPLLMKLDNTVFLKGNNLVILDRRQLPHQKVEFVCTNYQEVAKCIKDMVVQGAGDIALTAGYGLYLAACRAEQVLNLGKRAVQAYLAKACNELIQTRPTGYHMALLLNRLLNNIDWQSFPWSTQILNSLKNMIAKQNSRAVLTGKWAESLLREGDSILTHCFPGSALLHMLHEAKIKGKKVKLWCTETRPYLQGAKLTAWAASEMGFEVTLITDNMAAYCMQKGMINKIITAADRIALDGTVANKIGTYQLAIVGSYHKIPLYILGYGGPDKDSLHGRDILIEERDPQEVLKINGQRITGDKVAAIYPAFDLTPPHLIAGIITDRGILAADKINGYWDLPISKTIGI